MTNVSMTNSTDSQGDVANTKGRSLWQDARRRFLQNRAAVVSLIVLMGVCLIALFGPLLAAWDNETVDWNVLGDIATLGAPSLSNGHYFGTDELGRDLYSRVVQGTQVSLMVGIVGSTIAVILGTLYGATAGYVGGKTDNIMMRIVDILMSIPYMFVLILLLVVFGRSMWLLFVGVGMISWLEMSRIVRGQTLTLKSKEYVDAALSIGVKHHVIVLRHIIPNLLGVIVIYATLLVPQMILTESFISFLGLGVQEPNTSWGALISEGASTLQYGTYWQLLFPLAFFVITLFCFFFIGDGLRDALDPKDR